MRYYKFNRFKDGNKSNYNGKHDELNMTKTDFKAGLPDKESYNESTKIWSYKAFKGLQIQGIIETKADPNAEITRGSYPYAIINSTNKIIDANYPGTENISGNVITRLNNSNKSQLLNNFDVVCLSKEINYLYLMYGEDKTKNHNNLSYNIEMKKSFSEALAKGYSTMLTQLAYYVDEIATDMPISYNVAQGTYSSDDSVWGKAAGLIHYQTVLQNLVAPLAKYIETRSLEQHALNMSYRREAPIVTEIFGLLKKAAFISTLNAIGTNIIGEYFDVDWYKQNNLLANTACRKSNAITEPLITMCAHTRIPRCTMKVKGANDPYYDSNTVLSITAPKGLYDPYSGASYEKNTIDLATAVTNVVKMLDISYILQLARTINTDSSATLIKSSRDYFNAVVEYINVINLIASKFSTAITDLRTFIDKMQDSGMVYWKKGMNIDVNHISVNDPTYNVLLHNVLCACASTADEMKYDKVTQRWGCYTIWNKYTGVPTFDSKSGGSFITFGTRKLVDVSGTIKPDNIKMCLPVLFSPNFEHIEAINRLGLKSEITTVVVKAIENATLARLDALNEGIELRVPVITYKGAASTQEVKAYTSAAAALLNNIFGYGCVKTIIGSTTTDSYTCDPDILALVDFQIDDVVNSMITYARNYSPFRLNTPDGKRSMGFGA